MFCEILKIQIFFKFFRFLARGQYFKLFNFLWLFMLRKTKFKNRQHNMTFSKQKQLFRFTDLTCLAGVLRMKKLKFLFSHKGLS